LNPFASTRTVISWNQVRSVILAGRIRGQSTRRASLGVDDAYRGARKNSARLVGHGSENTAEITLGKQRDREQQHTQNRTERYAQAAIHPRFIHRIGGQHVGGWYHRTVEAEEWIERGEGR
jgi:hypothetical protein